MQAHLSSDHPPSTPSPSISFDDFAWAVEPVLSPIKADKEADEVTINAPWVIHFKNGDVSIAPLTDDTQLEISATDLDQGDDVLVVFDLHAPGITDKSTLTDAQQKRTLRKRKVRVVSPFVRSGGVTLHQAGAPARAGADDELMMYWSLSGSENKTGRRSQSGQQTLAFTAGDASVGTLHLHWENNR